MVQGFFHYFSTDFSTDFTTKFSTNFPPNFPQIFIPIFLLIYSSIFSPNFAPIFPLTFSTIFRPNLFSTDLFTFLLLAQYRIRRLYYCLVKYCHLLDDNYELNWVNVAFNFAMLSSFHSSKPCMEGLTFLLLHSGPNTQSTSYLFNLFNVFQMNHPQPRNIPKIFSMFSK